MAKTQAASLPELIANSKLYRMRRIMRVVPRSPRCKMCNVPFAGPGRMFKLAGFGPSPKNPNMCNACFEKAPVGGSELEIGVLFAAALIDKLVGDEVMALFIPLLIGDGAVEKMVAAGVGLLEQVGGSLPVGAGADFGPAYVGNVGEEDVKDFTALGDVVNTAARLQARAEAGQLVLSERVYQAVRERFPEAEHLDLDLKGKSVPVEAHVIEVGSRPLATAGG